MKTLNIFCMMILFVNFSIADSISESKNIGLPIIMSKIVDFNSCLKDYDLNAQIQDGYSITEIEYEELLSMWNKLNEQEKIQILYGPANISWKNTLAQFLLYTFNKNTNWNNITNQLACLGAKGNSLTLSNSKSLVDLKTAHNTLLDLLYLEQNMFVDEKIFINPDLKYEAKKRQNQKALQRLEHWETLINTLRYLPNHEKLERVNNFFNELIQPKSDHNRASNRDYWQSPIETLVRGKGDCEDFAIAKYVSLRLLGIPKNQLLLSLVRLPGFGELHAVLLHYSNNDNDPLVLDNLSYEFMGFNKQCIKRLSIMISQYNVKPLIGFNEDLYFEFKRGLNKQFLNKNPMEEIPMFTIAIKNSQNLLSNLSS